MLISVDSEYHGIRRLFTGMLRLAHATTAVTSPSN